MALSKIKLPPPVVSSIKTVKILYCMLFVSILQLAQVSKSKFHHLLFVFVVVLEKIMLEVVFPALEALHCGLNVAVFLSVVGKSLSTSH